MSTVAALALLLAGPFEAVPDATPLSSGELADLCSVHGGASAIMCRIYLRGAFEGVLTAEMALTDDDPSFCLPKAGVTLAEVRDTFLEFVREEDDQRTASATTTLLNSLEERYPCEDDMPDATDTV